MKTIISAVQFKADKKLKDYIEDKIDKLSLVHEGMIGSDVILRLENTETEKNKVVEMKVSIKNQSVFAKKKSKSFEESTDAVVEAIKKQLLKSKEKQINRKK